MRRARRSPVKIIILSVILVLILALIAVVAFFVKDISDDIEGNHLSANEYVTIEVVSGDTPTTLSEKLLEAGVIKYASVFRIVASMDDSARNLQIGKYELRIGEAYETILFLLSQSPTYRPSVRITFPEGYEVSDIVALFLKNGIGTEAGFAAAMDYAYDCAFLPAVGTENRLEGFLYPDTYDFYKDETEVQVFARMIANFNRKIANAKLEEKATAAGVSVYDALILGSIIQKEGGKISDYAMISSVFNNRIKIGMKLQSDACVSYPIPKAERLPSCTAEQLKTDTPYNVYIHEGLPPTPICCCSIEAIVSSCQPAESEYLYFIGTPDGQTIFAKTYEEHVNNVNKYLK